MSQILHTWGAYPNKSTKEASDIILSRSAKRQEYYQLCIKMLTVAKDRSLRLIMENPWGCHSFLQRCFITPPTLIDKNRNLRGDEFAKPTAYWFINCTNTIGYSLQPKQAKRVKKDCKAHKGGLCSEERSMIHPDYARNFICDFIIGKQQPHTLTTLF